MRAVEPDSVRLGSVRITVVVHDRTLNSRLPYILKVFTHYSLLHYTAFTMSRALLFGCLLVGLALLAQPALCGIEANAVRSVNPVARVTLATGTTVLHRFHPCTQCRPYYPAQATLGTSLQSSPASSDTLLRIPSAALPPIKAVCTAYAVDGDTGCFLRVKDAQPRTTLRVRVKCKATGAKASVLVVMGHGRTYNGTWLSLGSGLILPDTFGSTIEYVGKPASRVVMAPRDIGTFSIHLSGCSCFGVGTWKWCRASVVVGGDYPTDKLIKYWVSNPDAGKQTEGEVTSSSIPMWVHHDFRGTSDGADSCSTTLFMPSENLVASKACSRELDPWRRW